LKVQRQNLNFLTNNEKRILIQQKYLQLEMIDFGEFKFKVHLTNPLKLKASDYKNYTKKYDVQSNELKEKL